MQPIACLQHSELSFGSRQGLLILYILSQTFLTDKTHPPTASVEIAEIITAEW